MEKRYYLAYGSNLNVRQMSRRCPAARVVGTAVIPDYELLFKGGEYCGYLTIEKKEGAYVPVGVWSVSEADERALDHYEGYPDFYYKKELVLPVDRANGEAPQPLTCFVYIMHEHFGIIPPAEYYLQTCMDGYRSFGFDKNVLRDAVKRCRRQ